uniref:Capsid protein n=1 Tax=Bat astrovirus 4 TaxID=3003852 RepID=A0AA49EBB5_9VIRU|nr:MAG: capsid protein [Bat astrovirus 4]
MAEAPKPQRVRRRKNAGLTSAAPTADVAPSGTNPQGTRPRRRNRRRRARVPRQLVAGEVVVSRPWRGRGRLTRAIKNELKREGLKGPKVSVQQKISATFGMVRPNTSGNVELELNFFLHPSLAKEANDGTAFGPLQALAAQYSLWKIKNLAVRFTPMVGASAVSGTVIRASLNLSQSPGVSNWSGLGARMHIDMHPGQTATFYLRGDQLAGPRDGGWWFTDTNEEGSQSAGPIIEVHTMGETKSTFQTDRDWTGPLFLVEGIGTWQFANYNVKPALGTLERREGAATVSIKANSSQPITMTMDSASAVAQFMDMADPDVAPAAVPSPGVSVGETIFQIVDVGATVAQSFAPAPFGWLIKGGWWFVKKLLGRARDGTSEFVVYASLQDAQNNKPAIASESLTGTTPKVSDLMVTQINTPNVGPNPYTTGVPRAGPQIMRPGTHFRVSSQMLSELFIRVPRNNDGTNIISVPVSAIPGVLREYGTGTIVDSLPSADSPNKFYFIQTPWWIGKPNKYPGNLLPSGSIPDTEYLPNNDKGGYLNSLYKLINPIFTDQSGDFDFLEPEGNDDGVLFFAHDNFGGGALKDNVWVPGHGQGKIDPLNFYRPYGRVVATAKIHSGTTPVLDMILTLIKVTKNWKHGYDNVKNMFIVLGDNAANVAFAKAPYANSGQTTTWQILEGEVLAGTYMLGISYTNAAGTANGVDIPTFLIPKKYSRVESNVSPIFPYNLCGQMLPATSVSSVLDYVEFHPPSREFIEQLRGLGISIPSAPFPSEVSGESGPSMGGEGVEDPFPCILPPVPECEDNDSDEDDSSHSGDSLENFFLDLSNEMINLPRRWLKDPEFSRFMDM